MSPSNEWLGLVEVVQNYSRKHLGFEVRRLELHGLKGESASLRLPERRLVELLRGNEPTPVTGERGERGEAERHQPERRQRQLFDDGRPPEPTHTSDFRKVRWGSQSWVLTPGQALVVARLWDAWKGGEPDVKGEELLGVAGSDSLRLADLFKRSAAWQTLVISAGAGYYRLCFAEDGEPDLGQELEEEEDGSGQ